MSTKGLDVSALALDATGRVVLGDPELEHIAALASVTLAAGLNRRCSGTNPRNCVNSNCDGSINNDSCSNSGGCDNTNNYGCENHVA
ncbi:MAG TPA: hypothetical protein VFF65_06205 [Phycisphaerales bacterium]|nr:hypothetical protein [Phycisphaerales bacterium]